MTEMPEGKLRVDPLNLKSRQFITKRPPDIKAKEKSRDTLEVEKKEEAYIREYNEEHRPETLVEIYRREHKGEKVKAKAQDLEDRKFDWERDMNQGTKAGSSKSTGDLMNRIGSINSRFASGSSKRFL